LGFLSGLAEEKSQPSEHHTTSMMGSFANCGVALFPVTLHDRGRRVVFHFGGGLLLIATHCVRTN
jgi:hypothetical protein